jgi:hypothetical protein
MAAKAGLKQMPRKRLDNQKLTLTIIMSLHETSLNYPAAPSQARLKATESFSALLAG